jgi:hypothetical protein
MRLYLPLYLLLAVTGWMLAAQDLSSVPAENPTGPQYEDGTGLPPPPPPPGPKNQ